MRPCPTGLIADDEPLLRQALVRQLEQAWPDLEVVAQARNGREAVAQFEALTPDVCFLDVQMPGMSGIDVAREIGRRAHLVFVTAHDQYAVQAFTEGAVDYLVKPVDPARLHETVSRLKERIRDARAGSNIEAFLEQLTVRLRPGASPPPLHWIRAGVRQEVRLIPVAAVDYLRADTKNTLIAWHDDAGRPDEALVRTSLKELIPQLDPHLFVQVHRSVVVNIGAISRVARQDNETAEIHLKGRKEVLPVSRTYLHLFRQM